MKKAMVILNPSAGNEEAKSYESLVKEVLGRSYGEINVKHTKGPGDATEFASLACNEQYDLLVSMGAMARLMK